MLKLVSFHIQARLDAFLQILENFSQICLRPLVRESPCTKIYFRIVLWLYWFVDKNQNQGRQQPHEQISQIKHFVYRGRDR